MSTASLDAPQAADLPRIETLSKSVTLPAQDSKEPFTRKVAHRFIGHVEEMHGKLQERLIKRTCGGTLI